MLARLDQDLAPLRSSVNREGNLLRLHGAGKRAEVAAGAMRTLEQMGYVAEAQEDTPQVSRWFGAADADELSQEEALVLAQRWTDELAAEGVIKQPQRLLDPLRAALLDAFRAAARTGAIDDLHIDYEAIQSVVDDADAQAVRRWIDAKLRRPDLDG